MLKQLIQRLLDSRTTPQQAKDCNDLDFSKEITVLNTTAISSANFTYIAPDAGYIYRWIQCSGKSDTAMGTDIVVNGKRMSGLAINNGYFEFGETLRVNKGASVKFGTWGISTIAQYLVKFVPLGGGYNLFIRRAQSCLRPSFNFLLRSFSRVNGKQSKHGIFQKSETRLHSHQRQGKTLFTRLQRTDTFKSSCETARRAKNSPSLCTQEEMKTAVQGRNSKILMDGFLYIYPFSRVKLSRFSAQESSQTLSLRSIRTTNPQTGGALC